MSNVIEERGKLSPQSFAWFEPAARLIESRRTEFLIAAIALQFMIVIGMVALQGLPHVIGEPIKLRVIPVDPRSLFRGDYVILSYDFSRRNQAIDGLDDEDSPWEWSDSHAGQTVFVWLEPEPDGVHWRTRKISLRQPPSGKFLRGRLTAGRGVVCGIESYFVQEGTGKPIEKAIQTKKVAAEVVVTFTGQAALKRLILSDD